MDQKIEKALEKIFNMYEEMENELLKEIATHFFIEDTFENSDYWRIQKLQELGAFNKEAIKIIAKYSNKSVKEVEKALKDIGIESVDYKTLEKAYKQGKLRVNPETLRNNKVVDKLVAQAIKTTENYLIELSPKILEKTKQAYLGVVERAYVNTVSGSMSYSQAIKNAINDLGNRGITTLTYLDTTGGIRNYSIEATVRRDVLTATRKMNHELTEDVIKELQPEKLYLSEHLFCRPEHFSWQGTIINTDELVDITDYGSITGLGGINCKHYFEPYFGDEDGKDLKTYSKEECDYAYDMQQHQRYLERGIRKWKRKRQMFEKMGLNEEAEYCKDKQLEWTGRLDTYVDMFESIPMKRDFTREQIASE